jgi:hypothetical protein
VMGADVNKITATKQIVVRRIEAVCLNQRVS